MSVYSWLDDDAFCATHVRGLTPHEALARLGIEVFEGDDECPFRVKVAKPRRRELRFAR